MVSICNSPVDNGSPAGVVKRSGRATIPTEHGLFEAVSYVDAVGHDHMAYVSTATGDSPPLVRIHSECLTGDVLGSLRCDCGSQLRKALEVIGQQGGIVVYLRGHEGRGIGLGQKLRAYKLQDSGLDTVDANEALGFAADPRTYEVAAAIVSDLGYQSIRLLSNNPAKSEALASLGIHVADQLPLTGDVTAENVRYLETKRVRMAHTFDPCL